MLTIYYSFVRLYLACGGIIYDKTYNALFHQNLGKFSIYSVLSITGAKENLPYEKFNKSGH